VTFDSLRGAPLAGAFVTMTGSGANRSATSDSLGRFAFDSVVPGLYTFAMQHAAVEALGFAGLSTRVQVTGGALPIQIVIPPFATLWKAACGEAAPADSGFVYGVVRDAITQQPVRNATVDITWVDVAMDSTRRVSQKRWRNQARSDGSGSFGVCGVPAGVVLHAQALTDSAASGVVDLVPNELRVHRRDFTIAPTDTKTRGVVVGMLTGAAGNPFRDARAVIEGLPEVRSNPEGRFVIRDVPVGTRQVEISAIGMAPITVIADVAPNDTALVSAVIERVVTLDRVVVNKLARQQAFDRGVADRKRVGLGYMMDSSKINQLQSMATVFDMFPGTEVRRGRGGNFSVTFLAGMSRCNAIVWLDGRRSDTETLAFLHPEDIALVEVYPHRGTIPTEFQVPRVFCGAVAVWTKYYTK
jgi:hypothetical protein